MRLIALRDFSWAHRGCIVEEFLKGQEISTEDADLIRVSIDEGWAKDGEAAERARQVAEQAARIEAEAAARAEVEAAAKAAAGGEERAREAAAAEAAQKAADEKAAKPADNKARKGAPETK